MEGIGTVVIIFLLVCILALILIQIFNPPEVKVQQVQSQPSVEEQDKKEEPRDYRFSKHPLNERYKWWGANIDHPLVTSSGHYDPENGMYYYGTQYLFGTDVTSGGSNVMSASNAPINYNSLQYSSGSNVSSSANASGFMNFDLAAFSPF